MIRPSTPLPGFPPPVHELLLKACLFDGAPALASWHEWRRLQDFDLIDPSSQRLIPLLHHNLARLGVPADAPDMGRYSGIHRKTWYENAAALVQAAAVIKELTAAGIPTLILKGTALASAHYHAGGLRPVGDADILVPASHAPAALRLLLDKDWKPHPPRAAATAGKSAIPTDAASTCTGASWPSPPTPRSTNRSGTPPSRCASKTRPPSRSPRPIISSTSAFTAFASDKSPPTTGSPTP